MGRRLAIASFLCMHACLVAVTPSGIASSSWACFKHCIMDDAGMACQDHEKPLDLEGPADILCARQLHPPATLADPALISRSDPACLLLLLPLCPAPACHAATSRGPLLACLPARPATMCIPAIPSLLSNTLAAAAVQREQQQVRLAGILQCMHAAACSCDLLSLQQQLLLVAVAARILTML
jgi:hypothetical protein